MKRILLPCDFSAPSREAFRFAAALAKMAEGEVLVLKVTALPVMYEPGFGIPEYGFETALISELEDDTKDKLETLIADTAVAGQQITLLNETGPIVPTIREVARSKEIDVVVMGTHGEGNWLQSLIGSNTEKVVHGSSVPVIAIHKFYPPDKIKNIVFPTNLPLNQPVAMERLKALQSFFGARLQILFVNSPNDFHSDKDIGAHFIRFVEKYKLSNYSFHTYNDVYPGQRNTALYEGG